MLRKKNVILLNKTPNLNIMGLHFTSTGAVVMTLFEVKSAEACNAVRSISCKAALQLMTHLLMLNRELALGFNWLPPNKKHDWVRGCNWQNLEGCWVQVCVVFPHYTKNTFVKANFDKLMKEKHGVRSSNIRFMNGNDVKEFSALQLEAMFCRAEPATGSMAKADEISNSRLTYQKVAAWCLLHTFGTIIHRRSQLIDQEQSEALTACVCPIADCECSMLPHQKTAIALLTGPQRSILNQRHDRKKPVLIVGSAGTGKTFLLLAKVKQLHEDKKLSKTSKALVVIEEHQVGLRMFLEDMFTRFDETVILRIAPRSHDKDQLGLTGVLDVLIEAGECVKYLFVDQMEDFLWVETDILELLAPFRKHEQLELMWFLWNGRLMLLEENVWGNRERFEALLAKGLSRILH